MRFRIALLFLFLTTLTQVGYAQPGNPNKGQGELDRTPNVSIDYSMPDLDSVLFEDDVVDSSRFSEAEVIFMPEMDDEESVIWFDEEDEEGEFLPVLTAEQVNIDSSWITYAEYYAVWDTRSVNPYRIDASAFNDTISLALYDSLEGYKWSMPLTESQITSPFGFRGYRWHYGVDLELDTGDPVVAVFDGVVRIQQYDGGGYGHYVLIRHYNGLETIYGHLSKPLVKVGQYVKAGELIGLGGSTGRSSGPHLHFEVRYEGNAFDPSFVFDFNTHSIKMREFSLMPEHYEYLKKARRVYYHTVRSGETLGSIARKYRVSITTLCRLNGIRTTTPLRIGKRLRIR